MKKSVQRVFLIGFVFVLALSGMAASPVTKPKPPAIKIVIDADTGVDDAAAIAYLLSNPSKVNILGITAVAGNTTVENAANNDLILLDTAQRTDIPVVVGAAGPLVLAASHQGMFVHGPDGFWFTSYNFPPHDLSVLSHDAPGFLCSHAQAGVTLLALAVFGGIKGRFTGVPVVRASLQTCIIGGLAAAAAFAIARWIS